MSVSRRAFLTVSTASLILPATNYTWAQTSPAPDGLISRQQMDTATVGGHILNLLDDYWQVDPKKAYRVSESILLVRDIVEHYPGMNSAQAQNLLTRLTTIVPPLPANVRGTVAEILSYRKYLGAAAKAADFLLPDLNLGATIGRIQPYLDIAGKYADGQTTATITDYKNSVGQAFLSLLDIAKATAPAGVSSPFKSLVNGLFFTDAGTHQLSTRVDSTFKDVARQYPQYFQKLEPLSFLFNAVAAGGLALLTNDNARQAFSNIMQGAYGLFGDVIKSLVKNSDSQSSILDWETSEEQDEKVSEDVLKLRELGSKVSAGVKLLGGIVGLFDSKLGNEIATIGPAIVSTVVAGIEMISAIGTALEAGFSIGTATATGNFIGAAFAVFSLFGVSSSGNGPDAMVGQIVLLRREVQQLREEMHDRFDRIDKALNTIFTTLTDNFQRIIDDLDDFRDQFGAIRLQLFDIQASLLRIEQKMAQYWEENDATQFEQDVSTYLRYLERTDSTMTLAEFNAGHSSFRTWAISEAKESTRAGDPLSQGDTRYNNAGAYEAFLIANEDPLAVRERKTADRVINYLRTLPRGRADFGFPMLYGASYTSSTDRLANPLFWSIAVSVYLKYCTENPERAASENPPFVRLPTSIADYNANTSLQISLNAIYLEGLKLREAVKHVTRRGNTTNTDLFNRLYSNYTLALDPVYEQLQNIETDYYQHNSASVKLSIPHPNPTPDTPRLKIVDIFAGAYQSINWTPSITTITLDGTNLTIPSSSAVYQRFSAVAPFNVATFLQFGSMQMRCAVNLIEPQSSATEWQNISPAPRQERYVTNSYRVDIAVSLCYEGAAFKTYVIITDRVDYEQIRYQRANSTANPEEISRVDYELKQIGRHQWFVNRWTAGLNLRVRFETTATENYPAADECLQRLQLQLQTEQTVLVFLRQQQINLYNDIRNTKMTGSTITNRSQSLLPRVKELRGAYNLWTAYIRLGMSQSFMRNDQLHGLIEGDERILEMDLLYDTYDAAVVQLQQGINLPKVTFEDNTTRRYEALHEIVTRILQRIQDATPTELPTLLEGLDIVETTLQQIEHYHDTRYQPTLADYTAQMQISRSSVRYDRGRKLYLQTLTVRNIGTTDVAGTVSLIAEPPNQFIVPHPFTNANGISRFRRSPYFNLNVGQDNIFRRNATARIVLASALPFNPTKYVTRIKAGSGNR